MIGKLTIAANRESANEPRWPAGIAIVAIGGLYAALPPALIVVRPRWLILAIGALMVPTAISHRTGNHFLNQVLGYILNGVVTLAMMMALGCLLSAVTAHTIDPKPLLWSAAALWWSNILVFASWYWRLDAGGPHERARTLGHTDGAFLFPQMTMDPAAKDRRRRARMGTELRRLSVSGIQHQHRIFADRRSGAVALGKDPDDASVGDLPIGDCFAGRPRGEHSLTMRGNRLFGVLPLGGS